MPINSPSPQPPPPAQLSLGDIYHVLFKHKWMILIFSILGFAAAIGLYFVMPPPYVSEAELLVRFIQDTKTVSAPGADAQVKPVDARGENIMSTEAAIISSLDVAASVVDALGAEKILGKGAVETNRQAVAVALSRNLEVEVPKKGNVLSLRYKTRDPELAQPVLRQVIDTYFKKHMEIHLNLGVLDERLTQQTDQLRSRLTQTEDELRKVKAKAGVISLEDTRKQYSQQVDRLHQEISVAEADLEERRTVLSEMVKLIPTDAPASTPAVATNALALAAPGATDIESKPKLPTDLTAAYKRLSARLEANWKREQELLAQFTPENILVKEARAAIDDLEKQKKELEQANPRLLEDTVVATKPQQYGTLPQSDRPRDPKALDLPTEAARVTALAARIKVLNEQLSKLKTEAAAVDEVETSIVQLQRKKEIEETQFKYYSTSLEQARVDSTLDGTKLSNIREVQSPSLPLKDTKPLKKKMAMTLAGGICGGIGLAFLLEMILNQSVRKPEELETHFGMPVFLSIPKFDFRANGKAQASLNGNRQAALANPVDEAPASAQANGKASGVETINLPAHVSAEIAPWDEHHDLHPYSEALRDRLVSFFELKNMTHKPKLIALTSCSPRSGVTTLAAGLAASLSETGEGNVLLVDMNLERGAAHPFYKGKPACGLADLLEQGQQPSRTAAQVQENLYMVHGGSGDGDDRLPKVLPKRFAHLLPKLQASDYDYIIFDMPPINQTSVTPRLAGFMDMVFLVVESEKTNRNWVKQASALLHQSKANIGAVLNKRRQYTPRWLHQEF